VDDEQICIWCKEPVENPNHSGVLCQSCYEEQTRPASWKDYVSGPSVIGLIAALAPLSFSLTLNGMDFVAAGGGAVAVVAGAAGAMMAQRERNRRKKKVIGSIVVILLGCVQLYLSGFWL